MRQSQQASYQDYLKSDTWKCAKSLSGAHHWVENRTLCAHGSAFRCVHCGQERLPLPKPPH